MHEARETRRGPSSRRAGFAVVAVGALVAALILLWPRDLRVAPQPPEQLAPSTGVAAARPAVPVAESAGAPAPIVELQRDPAAPDKDAPQGIHGRLVDASGAPVAGVPVQLNESPGNDPAMLLVASQTRHLLTPVASCETATDGSFELGLRVAEDKAYDLFVLSPRHATLRLTGLRLLADTWHDVGEWILEPGAKLQGRVTVAGNPQLPAPQAMVSVTAAGLFSDSSNAALTLGALIAHTDAAGFYELDHAPTRGVVQVSAVAPGFAKVTRSDVEVNADEPVTVDFELPTGMTLTGDVRASSGDPIAEAVVTAWPDKPGMAKIRSTTNAEGVFALRGLHALPHRVLVAAKGYAPVDRKDVDPGEPLHVVLLRQHRIHVTAKTPKGAVLRTYRLALRRFFAAQPDAPLNASTLAAGRIGALHEVAEQRVRLDAATDHAEIVGVPGGLFVCEVEAEGWAKTLSTPLRFSDDASSQGSLQRIEVTVSFGAELHGRVVDEAGQPIAGATVATLPTTAILDNPLLQAMQRAVPPKITALNVQTDGRGAFTLPRLAAATYQLLVQHPDKCREVLRDINCQQASRKVLPDIVLRSGTSVRGTARLDGKAQGQIKVVLSTRPGTRSTSTIRLETVTDGEGNFAFERPIPPGGYVIQAAAVASSQPDQQIFHQMLQFRKSATTFFVSEGQRVVEKHLLLPAN